MEIIHEWKTYEIDKLCLAKYRELINLLLLTESMKSDKKQYWLDSLEDMSTNQILELFKILDIEKTKLKELDDNYELETLEDELDEIDDVSDMFWKK